MLLCLLRLCFPFIVEKNEKYKIVTSSRKSCNAFCSKSKWVSKWSSEWESFQVNNVHAQLTGASFNKCHKFSDLSLHSSHTINYWKIVFDRNIVMFNSLYHLLNMPLTETKSETFCQLLPSAIDKVGYQKPITNE